ncbi:PIN domain-containing protein [Methylocapsa acidiphila]|uniref:PIN domain-containing protein n=1 Tax=Methylocapsa acidiphila TaxID=133552 RepID=UPI00047EF6DE|nr:PIN domain-containing protein [Methylocapsa acidiphila]
MTARLFIDTNILIYALDPGAPEKRAISADLLRRTIKSHTLVLSPQNLNECYRVLTQRRRLASVEAARAFLTHLMPWCVAPLDAQTTLKAWAVQDEAGLAWWDALLIASALIAGCKLFISEDMQDGQLISGMRIVNPFGADFLSRLAKQ